MKESILITILVLALATVHIGCVEVDIANNGAGQVFKLENGWYKLHRTAEFSDREWLVIEESELALKIDNGDITIVDPNQPEFPIMGELKGSQFTAKLNDAGGVVFFKGKLIRDNHIDGTFNGTSEDGETTVEGTFEIIIVRAYRNGE